MYDSFDMACHDEDTALRLNIRVNSENLLPTQQKYNLGSLRIPADPSWPKIPQRRLPDDAGDLIEPPCIVTSSGTPRRSRTIVRIPQSQSCKLGGSKDSGNLNHWYQKTYFPQNQLPRRRSGCSDPRFKKVTTVKSQMTSTDLGDPGIGKEGEIDCPKSKNCESIEDKTVSWKDMNRGQVIQQAAEKPDETRGTESIGIQTVQINSSEMDKSMTKASVESNKMNSEPEELGNKIRSPVTSARKQFKTETARASRNSENQTPRNLENGVPFKNDRPHETTSLKNQGNCSESTQNPLDTMLELNKECYDAQIPLLSYQKVPVQRSREEESKIDEPSLLDSGIPNSQSASIFKNIEIPKLQLPNDAVPQFLNFGNTKSDKLFSKYVSNDSNTNAENYIKLEFKSSVEKLMKNINNEEKCRPQQLNEMNIFHDSLPKHNFHIYYHQDKPFQSVISDSASEIQKNLINHLYRRNSNDREELFESRDQNPADSKYKTLTTDRNEQGRFNSLRQKRKMKSDQHLTINKKYVQSSEPQITSDRKRISQAPYLKKANSYLSKYIQKLTSDSESNYAYQYYQQRSVSSCEVKANNIASEGNGLPKANFHDSNNSEKIDKRVISHSTDLKDGKREHCIKPYDRPSNKDGKINCSSAGLEKRDAVTTEKPTSIPFKTQELLNKSYWEYYNKLKLDKMENGESPQEQYSCQIAMGAPKSKKRRTPESIVEESNNTSQITGDQVLQELSLPEIRTLEQCSVLSTMINKRLDSALQPSSETIRTKQIYLNGNMRSSSDPTAGTQSAILKKLFPGENEDSIVSSAFMYKQKHKRDKNFNSRSSKLKSIGEHPVVFFGCMVYALIVFLPMIYDYFSYEEHDEYEDLSYVEIAFAYILASFKEAFGEFVDMINKVFLKPRSCRKCNNLT